MTAKLLAGNICDFYRHGCCWPYAVSFFLVLIIYWLDFFFVNTRCNSASLAAYGIIFAYYLRNVRLYAQAKIKAANAGFFIIFLSSKITVWGLILVSLYLLKSMSCV